MNRKVVLSLSVLLCVAAFGSLASAQLCTVTASAASYTIPATSHYDDTQTSNFTGVGTGGDILFEDGWWFRVSGDTAESFFPPPDTTNCAGAAGTITWANVSARGFSATNTLGITSAAASSGVLTLTMSITNLSTTAPLTISLFHGADFDVNGSAGTDTATLITPNTHLRITDTTAGTADYRASGPAANAFLVRPFAATTDVFGLLGDTAITDFDNSGLPASSIDFTGAFQWNRVIPASGTASFTVTLTGNSPLTPTAAGVEVSGRVLTSDGRGLTNAQVTLTNDSGVSRNVPTSRNGSFVFGDVEAGQTYVISIGARRYSFSPQVIAIKDNVSDIIFTPDTSGDRK